MSGKFFKVLVAPDSFKECLTAPEVAAAMAAGWLEGFPEAEVDCLPLADGGEGTAAILLNSLGGEFVSHRVTGPMGDQVDAGYVLLEQGNTAVVELALASGLALVPPNQRDVGRATTYGTGELLKHALERGCSKIILALGGSATNDGGAGLAQALGFGLLKDNGEPIGFGGTALGDLAEIEDSSLMPQLSTATFQIACDVTNPLCGPTGATWVYGPQKGAAKRQITELDRALSRFGTLLEERTGRSLCNISGIGAAGGAALPVLALAQAELRRGIEVVAEATDLENRIKAANLVLTGEGALDAQSAQGKVISGVVAQCARHRTSVIALAGTLKPGYERLYGEGLTAAYSIAQGAAPLELLIDQAPHLLRNAALNIARTLRGELLSAPAKHSTKS